MNRIATIVFALSALLWPHVVSSAPTSAEVAQSVASTIDAAQANTQANITQTGQIEALQEDFADLMDKFTALTERVVKLENGTVAEPPDDPVVQPDPLPVKVAVTGDWVLSKLRAGQKDFSDLAITGGVRLVWEAVHDVTFTRCDFRRPDAGFLLVVQSKDDGSAACKRWTFNDCTFQGAVASGASDDCSGMFLAGVDQFTFNGGAAVHNGWYGDSGRWMRNHNVYLLKVGKVVFNDFLFKEGASQGLKAAGFDEVQVNRCTFDGNIVDLAADNRYHCGQLLVSNTAFKNTGGTSGSLGTYAWSVDLNFTKNSGVLDLARFTACTWVGPAVTGGNNYMLKAQGGNITRVELIDCNYGQWSGPQVVNNIGDRLKIINTSP